jgi:leucyl aminopeptidase
MTDFSAMLQPDKGQPARTIHIVDKTTYPDWLNNQPERARAAIIAQGMKVEGYAHAILPGNAADDWSVVTVTANVNNFSSWCLAKLAAVLPPGTYRLASGDPGVAMFGWLTGQYRYTRYKTKAEPEAARVLLTTDSVRMAAALREATAVCIVRDLVNAPATDLGPAELEEATADLARRHKAELTVTKGDPLEQGYPMIAAVGRAAGRQRGPRLIELVWGNPAHPRIAIVGKGVTFDSGGLNIKPGNSMALMKKDMGGAAHALALARLVMETGLPVRLHLLVAAVENSIAGDAMRPGDILTSRKGLTVEVDNTDAEGRLILGDALTKAVEDKPELIIDFATLTGAARVALGPDLPALFANDDALADAMLAAGKDRDDPLWRLPLWDGYDEMLKAETADITNSPSGGFAGSITAALFLRRFVPKDIAWAHLDTFAWRPAAKPGRSKGGAALGLRAAWGMLEQRFRAN